MTKIKSSVAADRRGGMQLRGAQKVGDLPNLGDKVGTLFGQLLSLDERHEARQRPLEKEQVAFSLSDSVEEIMRLTGGRGVDVALEALGTQTTFEACLRALQPGGTLSSLGVYSTDLTLPVGPSTAGLGDYWIVTNLCPGGKERMRRLMSVIESSRVDLGAMVTRCFKLDDIKAAYDLFAKQRDEAIKIAITP